jgi:ATP-dependent DNA helicase RecG
LPDARRVASLISAFANTNGGTLVVGVQEGGEIVGVDHPEDARLRLEQANDLVTPSVDIQTETVRVDDKSVLIIRVPKGPAPPYLAAGVALQRFGENVVPLTSQTLSAGIRERATSLDDLREEVERLSGVIETLNQALIKTGGWRAKIPDMILGGIIGAVISVLISLLIGLL